MIQPIPLDPDDEGEPPTVDDLIGQKVIPSARLEQGVIADCITANHMPGEVPFLRPEHFYTETDRAAWQALIELEALGCRGEIETVIEHLKRTAHLPDVEWAQYCVDICCDPSPLNPFNFEHDAHTVYDYALRRKKIREHEQEIITLSDLTVPLAESGLVSLQGVVHSAAEAFEPLPPVDWLVKMVLAPGMLVLVYGKPATKKTYCLFFLAACVALGKDWAGFETRQANVLIVDQESGHRRILRRMLENCNGALGDKTTPVFWVTMQGYKLSNRADIAKIKQMIIELQIGLVIIDSLSKHSAGDENSANEMSAELEGARELAHNPDTAVVMIHHSKKEDDRFRGSSAIEGSLDMMIRVDSKPGSRFVNFTMEKNRDGELLDWSVRLTWTRHEGEPEKDQFYLERVETQREEKREEEEEAPVLNKAEQYIVQYLRDNGECTRAEILKAADPAKQRSVSNALYTLLGKAMVRRVNPEEKGQQAARFALAEEPDEDEDDL